MRTDLDLIKNLLGLTDQEISKAEKIVSRIFNELCDDEKKDEEKKVQENAEDTLKSYFSSLNERYDNGKLVEKHEKEYVNGECTKDENFKADATIENKACNKECSCSKHEHHHNLMDKKEYCRRRRREEIESLRKANENYHSQVDEMAQYIDGLNDKIKKLEIENSALRATLNNIKDCF